MQQFVNSPHIPCGNTAVAVVDGRLPEQLSEQLERRGIRLIRTEPVGSVYQAVCGHPDLQLYHGGGAELILPGNAPERFVHQLELAGFQISFGQSDVGEKYPDNVGYNAVQVGNYLVCNPKTTDESILRQVTSHKLKIVPVKQGYTKCSVCIVDDRSIITADDGIHAACSKAGLSSLKITQGHIQLEGMNYGFIGGASGHLSTDEIGFYGNLKLHPDAYRIERFLAEHHKKAVSLGENLLEDYGSFLPLKEYSIVT